VPPPRDADKAAEFGGGEDGQQRDPVGDPRVNRVQLGEHVRSSPRDQPHRAGSGKRFTDMGLFSLEGRFPAAFQMALGVEVPEDFEQRRHQPGPSGLMTGANASAVVAMEVFVE
jgi:hypothetical protein